MAIDSVSPIAFTLPSSAKLQSVALDPVSLLTDDTSTVDAAANEAYILSLSQQAQELLDYYQQQYTQNQNEQKAQALADELNTFDTAGTLLDSLTDQTLNSADISNYYSNTLTNTQAIADNDNITYQLLLQLQQIRLVA